MKTWVKWTLGVVVVGAIVGTGARIAAQRKAQQAAVAGQAEQAKAAPVVELSARDIQAARRMEFEVGLPVSGALRAADSAFVKARAAGELQGLSLREGDSVRAGQIVARIDPTELNARLRQAEQQAEAARAQAEIAQRQFDNNKALVDQGFISRNALDTSQSNLNAARASHEASVAAVEVARKALADTELRAPIGGQVSQRLAQPGERVGVDARILEIVDLSRLELEAALAPADSTGVRLGQTATLSIEGSARPAEARVVRINPSAQSGTRSVLVYLQLRGEPGLRQGLFAQGTLGTQRVTALAIPLDAVRTDKPAPYVQTVEGQRIAHRSVTLGARGAAEGRPMVAVTGLAENATVLAGTVGGLREGTEVRIGASPALGTASSAAAPAALPSASAAR